MRRTSCGLNFGILVNESALNRRQRRAFAESSKQKVASPLLIPCPIRKTGCIKADDAKIVSDGIDGGPAFPLMNFSVPIGEREPARAIVKRPWEIGPLALIDAINEESVVVRIRVLIKGHPRHRRSAEFRLLEILPVRLVEPSVAVPVIGRLGTAPAEQCIHGIAPQARGPAPGPLRRAKIVIRRTLINPQRIRSVTRQDAFLYVSHVGVALVSIPRHHIVDPIVERSRSNGLSGSWNREVVAKPILIVT